MAKIKVLDINGNWVWLDTTTNQTTSITPLTGTIQVNTTRSVGGDKNTKRGRTLIAHNLVQNYNNRQTKVHNYGDLTRRLKLKQLTVSVDNNGEPIINLTDYNPGVEAPMKPYTPLEEFYVGAKVLDLPFKFGSKAIQYGLGRYGSRFGWNKALLSARNKILSDVFDRQSLKLITPLTTTLLYLTLKFTPTIVSPNKEGALTFFLRRPSKISIAERMGIPKGERNLPFKEKQLTEHVQGDEAVKMFKEYGGESIPEGSINGELLRKYVAEARERYGLIGNNNITDKEIAQALYKHSKELGGNTAAVNVLGEPQLLFRGDTRRYTQLKERMSPEELATKRGTMDNSLGNLFLGELPGTAGKHTRGLERYLVTGRDFMGQKRLEGSGTGSRAIMPDGTFATEWGNMTNMFPNGSYPLVTYNTKYGPNTYYKLPSSYSESGVNDINAFVVRTPQVRDASREISVLNDDFMVKGGPKVEYHGPIRKEVLDKDGFPLIVDEKGNVVADGLAGSSDRQAMALHYRYVLNDAKNKKQGLLKSNGETDGTPGNYLRDEHDDYTYFALPNFNIQGAKHLLPYDLRIPRNWKDKNIYRGLIPLTAGYTLYNSFNQPQLQYLK